MSSSFLAAAASRSSDNLILTDTAESLKNALDNGALTPADYAKRARQAGVEVATVAAVLRGALVAPSAMATASTANITSGLEAVSISDGPLEGVEASLAWLKARPAKWGARAAERLGPGNDFLYELDLYDSCAIDDEGARHIATALAANRTITSVDLRDNQIGDAGVEALITALQSSSIVTSLDLTGNKNIGEEAKAALRKAWGARGASGLTLDDGSSVTADNILGHEDVGGLVFNNLSLTELVALADANPTARPKIMALEERWLRGCVDLSGGTLEWLDIDKLYASCAGGWMAAYKTIGSLRTEFITKTMSEESECKELPETLPWGDETWTRMHDLPQEAKLRDAFARAVLYHPDAVDGFGDPQCDKYPVGVAFYKRTASAEGAPSLGLTDGSRENLYALADCFYKNENVYDDKEMMMDPVSVASLLANLPSPMDEVPNQAWKVAKGLPERRLEMVIFDAMSRCASFVALCVGDAPALTPAQAFEVMRGTSRRIVKERLGWTDGNGVEVFDDFTVGDKGVYDDDEECTGDDDEDILYVLGLDQIEKEMKAELVAVKEKYGLTHAGLVSAATGDAPIGLSWHEAYKSERATRYTTSRTGVMVEEAVAQYAAHKAELAELIGAQLKAVHGDGDVDKPCVYPIMLTDSDSHQHYWSGAKQLDNDHEGVQALAFVSEKWALIVAGKSQSN